MVAINPMYFGTLAFLMFSGMLLSIGFWAVHNLKKGEETRDRLYGFATGIKIRRMSLA